MGFFNSDIRAVDGGFFFQALWVFVMQSAMVAIIVRAMIVMPELGPVYFYGFCAGKYLKDMRSKVNERFDKISKGHDEKCSIHTKLSF